MWLRRERLPAGAFRRAFQLPDSIALDRVSASLERGVLSIRLPKHERSNDHAVRRVPVASKL